MEEGGQNLVTTVAAYWGAFGSSLALAWAVFSEVTRRRARLRVIAHRGIWRKAPPDPGDTQNDWVNIETQNPGLVPVSLTHVSFIHISSPHYSLVSDPKLPLRLEPGENHDTLVMYTAQDAETWLPKDIVAMAQDALGHRWYSRPWFWRVLRWRFRWIREHRRFARERRLREENRLPEVRTAPRSKRR